jgi:SAM-dependent methyltransferase
LTIAALKPGERVLDLGSGAGLDCFLASGAVGGGGRVIGVDMTPGMLARARANAALTGVENVEFRLGEIENIPVADGSIDVVISNCVINHSPDKPRVFREAFRVLKPGGRLAAADLVRTISVADDGAVDVEAGCGCAAGAAGIEVLEAMMREAGFRDIRILPVDASRDPRREWGPGCHTGGGIVSATIEAVRPSDACCAPGCCAT